MKKYQNWDGCWKKHINEEKHEYAAVVENYAEFLKMSNNEKTAESVIKKAQKKLSKVAG